MPSPKHQYPYGIIGNCSYLALIDETGNVGWLCWPRFDSSFLFGGLLDPSKGGRYWIRPAGNFRSRQSYLTNTNVLSTEFEADDGKFRVLDFAPRFREHDRYYKPLLLLRKIEVLSGAPRIRVSCQPVGEYGKIEPEITLGSNHLRYTGLEAPLRLTTNIPLHYIQAERAFVLDEPKYLALTWGTPFEAPLETTAEDLLRRTRLYWENWVLDCSIPGFRQEAVIRSALAVKLHQFGDTGAIIAASTTSLPESPGSGRTWDYRFCWIRDSHYTLQALGSLGHFVELQQFASYLRNIAVNDRGRYNPVYSILGEAELSERELDLAGYLGNRPVRVGNHAYTQAQHDLYGQILVSLLPLYVDQRLAAERYPSVDLVQRLLAGIEQTMDEPDAGLWEFRNTTQAHCYTFLFHWAGAAAASRIARRIGDANMARQAERLKAMAAEKIESCYNEEIGAYTQAIGTKHLDASLLQLITMHYLEPRSDRAKRHLERLEKELRAGDHLFFRYKHADDFGVPSVTFLICAYWYVEALAAVGRVDEAIQIFDKLSRHSNHLGLLSEDVDSETGSQWGNFPQVYSHVGLINAAFRIARRLDEPEFLREDPAGVKG